MNRNEGISQPAVVEISPQVLVQELDGEMVLLDLASEQYFGLDRIGAMLWHSLTEKRPYEQVCTQIADKFQVEESQVRSDLDKLLGELLDAGLIKRSVDE